VLVVPTPSTHVHTTRILRSRARAAGDRRTTALVASVFLVQFGVLLAISRATYERFTVGIDFGIFAQAWSEIGRGNLNPDSTLSGFPYLSSHFELAMWPLGLLATVFHDPFVLLVAQAAAIAGTGFVVWCWVRALLRRDPLPAAWTTAISIGTVVLLLANPVGYATAAQDFHFWPIATCFLVLAAYDLWSGRTGRMWVWIVLALVCGDVSGVYVLGIGLTGVIASRRTRRPGLAIAAAGIGWLLLAIVTGNNAGSHITDGYAYLSDQRTLPEGVAGISMLAAGALKHPSRPLNLLAERWETIVIYLRAGGLVGVLSPWGLGVTLVAVLTAGLQGSAVFISQPFQNFVITPFIAFGSVWLVVTLARRRTRLTAALAIAVGVLTLGSAVGEAVQQLPATTTHNGVGGLVSEAQADAFRDVLAQIPDDAHVIAPLTSIGRFATRAHIDGLNCPVGGNVLDLPTRASTVVIVMDAAHPTPCLGPGGQDAIAQTVLTEYRADVLADRAGVTAYRFEVPDGGSRLTLG